MTERCSKCEVFHDAELGEECQYGKLNHALSILQQIVRAEDDFVKSTGMKSNDALSAAIQRARELLK